jgi:anti-sigma regulatory factor (Ser/Thr protein kinase)
MRRGTSEPFDGPFDRTGSGQRLREDVSNEITKMMEIVIDRQICLSAELESLARFRDFIEASTRDYPGIDEHITYDLKLAVDEACTNIITHGYAGMNPGSIILNLRVSQDEVVIMITDFGHQFEPSEAPAPDVKAALDDRPTGGFGLYFIYQAMDGVAYETTEAGNILTLTKKLFGSASERANVR